MRPKVSILIPAYNHGRFVSEAIESVLNQTFQDFEICISDDFSQDNTWSEICKYRDRRIKKVRLKKNKGAVFNTWKAFQMARGEYIAILNSDDKFRPEKLQKQVDFLDNNAAYGAVFSRAELINEKGNKLPDEENPLQNTFKQENRSQIEWLRRFFWEGNGLCHPSVLIRRQCYQTVGFYKAIYRQLPDFEFWIRLVQRFPIHVLPEELVEFRILDHNANTSARTIENIIREDFEFRQILLQIIEKTDIHTLSKILKKPKITENNKLFVLAELAMKLRRENAYPRVYDAISFWIYSQLRNEKPTTLIPYSDLFNNMYSVVAGSNRLFRDSLDQLRNTENKLQEIQNTLIYKLVIRLKSWFSLFS